MPLTTFSTLPDAPELDRPRPDRLLAGNPLRQTWNCFERDGLSAGVWACEVGAWQIAFPAGKDEFFQVLEGRLAITENGGARCEFGPGDACVIPAGFQGVFEVLEPVRKRYVVMTR